MANIAYFETITSPRKYIALLQCAGVRGGDQDRHVSTQRAAGDPEASGQDSQVSRLQKGQSINNNS